jgi:hypothetical protein
MRQHIFGFSKCLDNKVNQLAEQDTNAPNNAPYTPLTGSQLTAKKTQISSRNDDELIYF